MKATAYNFDNDPIQMIDQEFDRTEITPPSSDHGASHHLLGDDLAWEDQLDNGDEISVTVKKPAATANPFTY